LLNSAIGFKTEDLWPQTLYWGPVKQVKHKYSQRSLNIKTKTCYYRCCSYRTYGCDATLCVAEHQGRTIHTFKGSHQESCTIKNGISRIYETTGMPGNGGIQDFRTLFRKRAVELCMERLWMSPNKVWEAVRDELVPEAELGVNVPMSAEVSCKSF